jgi:O-antigen ligase
VVLIRPSLDLWADRNVASVGGAQLNPASILAVLTIAVGVPYMIERWPELRRAVAIRAYLVFAAIAAIGVPLAPSITGAATEWLRLAGILVTYALAFLAASHRRALARLLAAAIASAAIPAAVGVAQWLHGSTRAVGDLNRTTGTFLHPDPYGIYLALVVVAALAVVLAGRSLWRWAALAVMAMASAALVLSYTRTGWVMVVLGVVVLGVVRYRWLLVVLPVVLVIAVAAVPGVSARVHELTKPSEVTYSTGDSFQSRVALWRENLPKAQQRPLIGLGFGAIVDSSSDSAHVHSDYVRALVETGLFGFLAFLWLLLAAVVGCARSLHRSAGGSRVLIAASLAGLAASVCYLLASGDSNLMTQAAVSGTAWTLIACGHAAGRIAADEGLGRRRRFAELLASPGLVRPRPRAGDSAAV